ncbi:proline iminopeptidase [Pseudoduganella lurida]|uniref:Proline iminopeptidase n=1 Tax=Pseudoduganella lurida TaxID=1036180 RepID=A0A562R8N3_9BURK|nr:proline iminopeptidase-family hydrolase [Pseudoduganella lurida]TWI65405.1 proline iminopeptidase [Pseudoduganella lurida]
MDRRDFISAAAVNVLATAAATTTTAHAAPRHTSTAVTVTQPDGLNPPGIRTAGVRLVPVVNGKYKVWTKKVGSGPVKVLLLHGGPGFTHEYLEAMEAFLPQAGIEMYYYDQLGCGNSDRPEDPSLWTLPRYLEELEEVRVGLGLDHFVLYGHSWGGMLAIDYALRHQRHLRGLVISNMTAGIGSLLRHLGTIRRQLPPATLARLEALERADGYDTPEYQAIMMEQLYPKIICRTVPWPDAVNRAFAHANLQIYNAMQGKNEFVFTGNLKDWERWDRLHEITVKALVIGARYDEMDPADMPKMAQAMGRATAVVCPNGSHLCMWDDQAFYFQRLLAFLKTV